jgi:Zn-dependent protease with chaperone function
MCPHVLYHTDTDIRLYSGKVFVFTGILPICQDEDGLAAVLGHEIAHVAAHHPAERMSNSIITMGAVFLTAYLFDISGQIPSIVLNLMYSLPNSRTQEVGVYYHKGIETDR